MPQPCLHLGMAVVTKQHTLSSLSSQRFDRERDTCRNRHGLRLRIDVMECKRPLITVVSTELTAPSSVLDQCLLDPSSTLAHCRRTARPTAKVPLGVLHEIRRPMDRALENCCRKPRGSRGKHTWTGVAPGSMVCLQPVLTQPISDASLAAPKPLRELRNAQSRIHRNLKLDPFHTNICSRRGRTETRSRPAPPAGSQPS